MTNALPTPTPPTLLLVEDDLDAADIYRTLFEQAGFRVLVAGDGPTALAQARAVLPAVILMDIGLPRMDGATATAHLKQDPTTRDIPVIAVTAHVLAEHRPAFLAAGFDRFCEKPCEPRTLLAVVQEVLYGTSPEHGPLEPPHGSRTGGAVDRSGARPESRSPDDLPASPSSG